MKTRIRNRFMQLFLGLSIGPLLVISGVMTWRAYTLQTERALAFLRHDLEDSGRVLVSVVDGACDELASSGRVAASLQEPTARTSLIESLLKDSGPFSGLLLLDADGRELARAGSPPAVGIPTWKDAQPFHVNLLGAPGHEAMVLGTRLASGETFWAGLRTEWLWSHLPAVHLERGQHFYLLSPGGNVLAQTAGKPVSSPLSLPVVNGFGRGTQDEKVLRASQVVMVSGQPLALLAERDAADALFPFYATLKGILVLVATLMCSAMGVGHWTIRRLTGPVQELRDAACAIESGDFSRQAPVRHPDEVGELADAFNRMTARLQNSLQRLEEEVAQRAGTEAHLKESVSILRAMFDATTEAVVVVGGDGKIINWSKRFASMWHLPEEGPGSLATQEVWQHVAGFLTDPNPFLASRNVVSDHDTYGTALLNTKDGRIIEEYARPNTLEGADAGCVWCFRDVTEQARRERELRESEERFRAIFESAHDGIFLKNSELRYTHVNPAMERIFGIPGGALIGHTGDSIFGSMGGLSIDTVDRRVLDGEVIELEDTRSLPEGERTFHVVKVPMRNHAGEIVGLCGITRDVTARKQAENALRLSEQRYRILAENVSDIIWTMDLNLQFTYMSPSVTRMQGYTVEEAVSRRVEEYLSTSSMAIVRNVFREELALERSGRADPKRIRVLELEQRCKDGHMIWAEITVSLLRDESGVPTGILGVTRDITVRKRDELERKRLEAQIQHTQKLESLGVLAGGIAHDFNNLLMGILGYAGLAIRELPPDSRTCQRIQQIEQAGQRAADLAKQLLAYSGRGKFVIESIDMGKLVQEMAQFLEAGISKKAVLRYDFAPNLAPIEGDATQVRQVVMNLITNASDALGEEMGIISINTGMMEADHEYLAQTYLDDSLEGGIYIYLEVSDTGCGMDEQTRARIFDPFFTTKFVGRGLGLAATLGIVRSHHGAIKVYSEPGMGSTFKVLFPASRDSQHPVSTKEEVMSWQGRGTILVVDDEPVVRDVAEHTLRPLGFDVLLAVDGQEGVEVFDGHRDEIVFVLLDMTMPRLSGEQTYEQIRQMRPEVPVLLSSGYNEQETVRRFVGQGLAGFIQKPYQPSELVAKIREILEGKLPGQDASG